MPGDTENICSAAAAYAKACAEAGQPVEGPSFLFLSV